MEPETWANDFWLPALFPATTTPFLKINIGGKVRLYQERYIRLGQATLQNDLKGWTLAQQVRLQTAL